MNVLSDPPVRNAATRLDPETGVVEEAAFFGRESEMLFGVTHLPPGEVLGGVLICSPLHAEFLRHYRNEVLVARKLASRGLAVHRFHYRGAGQSDGGDSELTFESMVEDTVAAGDRLRERIDGRPLSLLGTRWGGLIAGSAVSRLDPVALALWEPVTDPAAYFQEGFRALLLHRLKEGRPKENDTPLPQDQLRRTGSVDVLGYSIERSLYESALPHRLEAEIRGALPVFLLQLSRGSALRKPLAAIESELESRGCQVTTHLIREQVAWWFQDTDVS